MIYTSAYTLEQVTEHNKQDDTWVIINNKVYDVSSFVEKHPGGPDKILNVAGQEVTEKFNNVSAHIKNMDNIEKYLEGMEIGSLVIPSTSNDPSEDQYTGDVANENESE
jgi:cytochrome b involved in lipid metabolism